MGSKHLYHLGPVYCEKCHDYVFHYLTTDRPFAGVGPYSSFNFWMDFIKTSKVSCLKCGYERKPSKDDKELFEKLKKANLVDLGKHDELNKRINYFLESNNLYLDYKDEVFEKVVDELYNEYKQFDIPRIWFKNYFLIVYNSKVIIKAMNDYLYK